MEQLTLLTEITSQARRRKKKRSENLEQALASLTSLGLALPVIPEEERRTVRLRSVHSGGAGAGEGGMGYISIGGELRRADSCREQQVEWARPGEAS